MINTETLVSLLGLGNTQNVKMSGFNYIYQNFMFFKIS